MIDRQSLLKMIDHTILWPQSTYDQVRATIEYGRTMGTASVCVNPCHVKLAASLLVGSSTNVCTVISFPFGASTTEVKVREAVLAVENGADEVDMVINIGAMKSKDYDYVFHEIQSVVQAVPVPVKVIFDVAYLDDEEITAVCQMCADSGVAYAKTSTGFSPADTRVETVRLMRSILPESVKIKASGGVNNLSRVLEMIEAGAVRIGTAATAKIIEEFDRKQEVKE